MDSLPQNPSEQSSQISEQQQPGVVPEGADSDAVTTLDADVIA